MFIYTHTYIHVYMEKAGCHMKGSPSGGQLDSCVVTHALTEDADIHCIAFHSIIHTLGTKLEASHPSFCR